MNAPLGQENKVQGMTASANAFSGLCSCVYICGKVKKVSHELEMSRVGKRVQERVKGRSP